LLNRLDKRELAAGRSSALEYHFLNVHTDYRDASYAYQLATAGAGVAPGESVTLPVWVLDGDEAFAPLIRAGVAPGESVTLPVWVLDGDEAFAPLIRFALTAPLSKTVVVLCASLQEPGTILQSLNKWAKIIDDQIQNIFSRPVIIDARKSQELFWQEYVEPLDSSMQSDKIPSMETEHVRTSNACKI
uniref:Dynein light intermediate chain n=1 Tax=Gongylonema pulchrum TaxID=637853 RepID=A0A183EAD0_9BILA